VGRLKKIALALALALFIASAIATMQFTFSIPNRAKVKGVGLSIWWDYDCTQPVEYIDWGIIEPNETKTALVYIRSRSNVDITLSLTTEDWNPQNASKYITLTWDYNDEPLSPKEVTPIRFYLHVSPDVTGIEDFTFTIVVHASG